LHRVSPSRADSAAILTCLSCSGTSAAPYLLQVKVIYDRLGIIYERLRWLK